VADRSAAAEGWYRDPYGIHQDRWFSAGTLTALVRDQGVESRDEPPGYPPPAPPAGIPETDAFPADDLRRADEKEADGAHYDAETVAEQASDAATTGFGDSGRW
jgi:hypothetical protein